jgi:energy-coupling factor transporter ATP-binding protein EcfA2
MTLDDTRHVFQKWLHLPDTGSLDAVLATVVANRLDGDAVWLLLVGPPGGGKSEILNAITGLEDAHPTGTLTEASLLSGTPKKDAGDAKGGLLRIIGAQGIIVAKDFGSVLSMNRDARAQLLAALREVYDGSWTRHVGSDGGRTLHWEGKVGLVGGCTPTIDRHHAVMGAMGERFVLYRLPEVDANVQAREALGHAGRERQMRKELAAAAHSILIESAEKRPRKRNEQDITRLITLATLVARARSAVERDGYSRDIELVPAPEAPTRIIVMLARILDGLDILGATQDEAWALVTKIGLDCVPALRISALFTLADRGRTDTTDVALAVRYPGITTRRALEDLNAHGLVDMTRQGEGKAHLWDVTSSTLAQIHEISMWGATDMSSYVRTRNIVGSNTTEKPALERSGMNGTNTPSNPESDDFSQAELELTDFSPGDDNWHLQSEPELTETA